MNALLETTFDLCPFTGGDDPWNDIEWEYFFGSCLVAVDVECDAHSKQGLFGGLLISTEFFIADRRDALKQKASTRPWSSVGVEHLILKTTSIVSVKKHKKSVPEPSGSRTPSS